MINKVTLLGRIGKDAVVKHFQNDSAAIEFSMATTESWKNREGEWEEKTEWHNIKVYSKTTSRTKFIGERAVKGATALVFGKITTRSYDDKDGNKRYVTEIIADEVKFLDGKKEGGEVQSKASGGGSTAANNPVQDDDLPF